MSNTMWMMLGALGGELLLLLLVLLSVSFFRHRAQRSRDLQAVRALVARIKKGKPEREQQLLAFLEQNMGLSGDTLNQAKVAMLRAEMRALQRFAGIYREREATLAARFDDDLFAAIGPYHALVAGEGGTAGTSGDGDEGPADAAELEHLRKENNRLSDELRITMETMSRMLNEYSSMFVGGERDDAAPISATATAGAAAAVASETGIDAGDGDNEEIDGTDDDMDAVNAIDEAEWPAEDAEAVVAEEVGVAVDDVGDLEVSGAVDTGDAEPAEPVDELEDLTDSIFDQAMDDVDGEPEAAADIDVAVTDDATEPVAEENAEAYAQQPPEIAAEQAETAEVPSDAEAGVDEDDEIAAILNEAKSREMSARAESVDEALAMAADGSSQATEDFELDVFEEGESEIVDFGDADAVDAQALDDIDDLFDAAADDDPFADAVAEAEPSATKSSSVKSQSGG